MNAVVGPPITRDGARSAAQHELSKGIYHRNDDPWTVRLFKWFGHRLDHVVNTIVRHAPGGGVGAVALLVVIAVIVVVVRWRLGPLHRSTQVAAEVLPQRDRSAADYRREAVDAAQNEQWERALVARMRAAARELEERGVLDPRPGRTADELADEVARAHGELADPVQAATKLFDAVAYGGRRASAAHYETVVAADEAARRVRRTVMAG